MDVQAKCMDFVYMPTIKFPDSLKKEGRREGRKRWVAEGTKEEGWRNNKGGTVCSNELGVLDYFSNLRTDNVGTLLRWDAILGMLRAHPRAWGHGRGRRGLPENFHFHSLRQQPGDSPADCFLASGEILRRLPGLRSGISYAAVDGAVAQSIFSELFRNPKGVKL